MLSVSFLAQKAKCTGQRTARLHFLFWTYYGHTLTMRPMSPMSDCTCVHLTPISLKKLDDALVLHPFLCCSLSYFIPLSGNPQWKRQKPEAMADVTGTTANNSHGFVERATGCAYNSIPLLLPLLTALAGERPIHISPVYRTRNFLD